MSFSVILLFTSSIFLLWIISLTEAAGLSVQEVLDAARQRALRGTFMTGNDGLRSRALFARNLQTAGAVNAWALNLIADGNGFCACGETLYNLNLAIVGCCEAGGATKQPSCLSESDGACREFGPGWAEGEAAFTETCQCCKGLVAGPNATCLSPDSAQNVTNSSRL